jgi:hypothetical protein
MIRAMGVLLAGVVVLGIVRAPGAEPQEPRGLRTADFTNDPKWDSFRNRLVPQRPRITKQDFGYRTTNRAGGKKAGEIGGRVQRSTTPATYAMPIKEITLNDRITASGRFSVTFDDNGNGVLLGFFNSKLSRGWRTNHSLALRLDGNGSKYWVFYEYGTRNWLTGGAGCFEGEAYQKTPTKPFPSDGTCHDWSLNYDPDGDGGNGLMTFVLDGKSYELKFAPGHRKDGATFDRFGIWNHQTTGGTIEAYFDDMVVNGQEYNFDEDPKWEGRGNQIEFADRVLRPLQDFGYSASSSNAGGKGGEIGGVIWRGAGPAFYADRVGPLSLEDELFASGTIAFTGAGSDSGAYIGFFDAASKKANDKPDGREPQANALGILIEGPSRIGHYFRPAYGASNGEGIIADSGPIIRPDGQMHRWTMHYSPKGNGRITVTLDDQTTHLDLKEGHRKAGARFDRFGLFNLAVSGHYVTVWLDDLSYTEEGSR